MAELSPYFPRVAPGCEKVSSTFFACFMENGNQEKDISNSECGQQALETTCNASLKAYNSCVTKQFAGKEPILYRVPEAYRVRKQQEEE